MSYTVIYAHKYSNFQRIFAFIGVALMRLPLYFTKHLKFWKLMGCGKDASVYLAPDFKHWAHLTVWEDEAQAMAYQNHWVTKYFSFFASETCFFVLKSVMSHGTWDHKEPFFTAHKSKPQGKVAVLTRATIFRKQISRFRSFTAQAHEAMVKADGFVCAVGMGENPFNRQATFSVWESESAMQTFAYKDQIHADIIKRTRAEKWYSEECFARFEVLAMQGVLNGKSVQA